MTKFFAPRSLRSRFFVLSVVVLILLAVRFAPNIAANGSNLKEMTGALNPENVNYSCVSCAKKLSLKNENEKEQVDLDVRKFSSHKCFGSRTKTRSCIFKSLYLDVETKKFEYYSDSTTKSAPISFDHGSVQYDFLGPSKVGKFKGKGLNQRGFLYLHAGGRRGRSRQDRRWYEPWVAHKLEKAPPSKYATYVVNNTVMLWDSISPNSLGHLLVDNIIPIFIITRTFELEIQSMQVVLMASCEEHFNAGKSRISKSVLWCKHLVESGGFMSPGLTRERVGSVSEIFHEAKKLKKKKIIFTKVVLGGGGLAMWLHLQETAYHEKYADEGKRDSRGYGVYFRQLQQHFYRQHGIVEDGSSLNESPVIVVSDKRGGRGGGKEMGERRIANVDSVVDWIIQDFPSAKVLKVNFQPLSWHEQLRILSRTSIFISPPGSSSFRMLFLPKGARAIILSWPHTDAKNTHWEIDAWFRYQTYFEILNYRVEREELASNSTDPTVLIDSDYILNRSKLKKLIEQALKPNSSERNLKTA